MIFTDDIHYCASYIPEKLEFAVIGTTQILKDFSGITYPVVKEVFIGEIKLISRSYDDVYLIPMAARLKHSKETLEVPIALNYDEYLSFKDVDLKDFKLDHETETMIVKYPLSFQVSVDQDIRFKIHNGKLYKRNKLTDHGTIISDDWELMTASHPAIHSMMDHMVGDIMKDLLFGEDNQPNITIN